jgi:hypothetical protein
LLLSEFNRGRALKNEKEVLSRSMRVTDMPARPFHNLGCTDESIGIESSKY